MLAAAESMKAATTQLHNYNEDDWRVLDSQLTLLRARAFASTNLASLNEILLQGRLGTRVWMALTHNHEVRTAEQLIAFTPDALLNLRGSDRPRSR